MSTTDKHSLTVICETLNALPDHLREKAFTYIDESPTLREAHIQIDGDSIATVETVVDQLVRVIDVSKPILRSRPMSEYTSLNGNYFKQDPVKRERQDRQLLDKALYWKIMPTFLYIPNFVLKTPPLHLFNDISVHMDTPERYVELLKSHAGQNMHWDEQHLRRQLKLKTGQLDYDDIAYVDRLLCVRAKVTIYFPAEYTRLALQPYLLLHHASRLIRLYADEQKVTPEMIRKEIMQAEVAVTMPS